jgi:hypothetical protein
VNAPDEAFVNKESDLLQQEYQEFLEKGGSMLMMQTLTATAFDTLARGEYLFAVGPSGKVRFGREISRAEAAKIEAETGRSLPRLNHAFLFPGEAILSAGTFYIDSREDPKLVAVDAGSGHFFYSNTRETIYEDVSQRSNYYLYTLGHFFESLSQMEIPHSNILISKF